MITFTSTLLHPTILMERLKPERGNIPVVQQSVKDVLDDLKGDGLVDFDKIGTSNCTFTFPPSSPHLRYFPCSRVALMVLPVEMIPKTSRWLADRGISLCHVGFGRFLELPFRRWSYRMSKPFQFVL